MKIIVMLCLLGALSCKSRRMGESIENSSTANMSSFEAVLTPIPFVFKNKEYNLLRIEILNSSIIKDHIEFTYCLKGGDCQSKTMSYPLSFLHMPKVGTYTFSFQNAGVSQKPLSQTIEVEDANSLLSVKMFEVYDLKESILSYTSNPSCPDINQTQKNISSMTNSTLLSFLKEGFDLVSTPPINSEDETFLHFLIQPFLLQELNLAYNEARKRNLSFKGTIPVSLIPFHSVDFSSLEPKQELGLELAGGKETGKVPITYFPQSHKNIEADLAVQFIQEIFPDKFTKDLKFDPSFWERAVGTVSVQYEFLNKTQIEYEPDSKEKMTDRAKKFNELLSSEKYKALNTYLSFANPSAKNAFLKFPTIERLGRYYVTESFVSQAMILEALKKQIDSLGDNEKFVLFNEGKPFDPAQVEGLTQIKSENLKKLSDRYKTERSEQQIKEEREAAKKLAFGGVSPPEVPNELLEKIRGERFGELSFEDIRIIVARGAPQILELIYPEVIVNIGAESQKAHYHGFHTFNFADQFKLSSKDITALTEQRETELRESLTAKYTKELTEKYNKKVEGHTEANLLRNIEEDPYFEDFLRKRFESEEIEIRETSPESFASQAEELAKTEAKELAPIQIKDEVDLIVRRGQEFFLITAREKVAVEIMETSIAELDKVGNSKYRYGLIYGALHKFELRSNTLQMQIPQHFKIVEDRSVVHPLSGLRSFELKNQLNNLRPTTASKVGRIMVNTSGKKSILGKGATILSNLTLKDSGVCLNPTELKNLYDRLKFSNISLFLWQ